MPTGAAAGSTSGFAADFDPFASQPQAPGAFAPVVAADAESGLGGWGVGELSASDRLTEEGQYTVGTEAQSGDAEMLHLQNLQWLLDDEENDELVGEDPGDVQDYGDYLEDERAWPSRSRRCRGAEQFRALIKSLGAEAAALHVAQKQAA